MKTTKVWLGLLITLLLIIACSAQPSVTPPLMTETPATEITLATQEEPADIIFRNGVIITMETSQPVAEAVAIRGQVIQAVGTDEEISAYQGAGTVVIDLHGQALLPGIVDGHSHYVRNAYEAGVPLAEIMNNLLRFGITGDTEMHSVDEFINAMLQAEQNGAIKVRLNIFGEYNCGTLENGKSVVCVSWYQSNPPILDPSRMVRIPGVKIFADGAGTPARGCPYYSFTWSPNVTDVWPDIWEVCKNPYGDLYLDEAQLTAVIQDIQDRGYRAAFHAMGDAAIETILNALETVLDGESNLIYRHQILHNSVLSPQLMDRYVQMDILAQIGGVFNVSEADFYETAYGEPYYAWNANRYELPNLGIHVFFGQDYNNRGDINALNPFPDLYGFVTHNERLSDDSVVEPPQWVAQHVISVERALEMLTIEPAYAVSMEDYIGSLKPGKFADLIVISDNPLSMDPDDLYKISVWMTMVNGKVEYCAPGMDSYCPVEGQVPATATPSSAVTPQITQIKFDCDARAGSPLHVSSEDFIQTYIRWAAQTSDQVNEYIDAVRSSMFVDGVSLLSGISHGEIAQLEGSDLLFVTSNFDVGILIPGTHEIRTSLTFDRQITDGFDWYGPDTKYPAVEGICTVISEP